MPHPFSGGSGQTGGGNVNLKPNPSEATAPLRRYVCLPESVQLPSAPVLSGEFILEPDDLTLIISEPWDSGPGSSTIINEPWEYDVSYDTNLQYSEEFECDLLTGLTNYWHFDEPTGIPRSPAAGPNTLFEVGGPVDAVAPGFIGPFAVLTHATLTVPYLETLPSPSIILTGDWTFSCWMYIESAASAWVALPELFITKNDGAGTLELNIEMSGISFGAEFINVDIYAGAGASIGNTRAGDVGMLDRWSHLIITVDDTAKIISAYVNTPTSFQATAPVPGGITGSIVSTPAPFNVGRFDGGVSRVKRVRVDEVAFWSKVLTQEERECLWNGGSGLDLDTLGGP